MDINQYWIWISKIEGISIKEKMKLIDTYGLENLWEIDKSQAFQILQDNKKVDILFDIKNKKSLEK